MIVTVGSIRGAPGVTSWSLLLAVAWPAVRVVDRVVLEADVCGGVIGARYGLGVEPGAVSFTAGLRRNDSSVPLDSHGRRCGSGVWVVPAPESAEQAHGLWESSAGGVADRLAVDDRWWFVDAGRLTSASPAASFASRSAFTVLVCRATPEDLVAVPSRVAALSSGCSDRLGVVVMGRPAHNRDELSAFFGLRSVWVVRDSADTVAVVGSLLAGDVRARRSSLWRSAVEVAADISEQAVRPATISPSERAGATR